MLGVRGMAKMQIMEGLYQVGGSLNGITWLGNDISYEDSNTYILETQEGLIMFDCGCGHSMEQIEKNMNEWGLSFANVKACFITHPHFDHAGGAYLLKEKGIRLLASEETADAVARGDERCCGYMYHEEFVPCKIDEKLKDGETITLCGYHFTCMHLPGHTNGCMVYCFEHKGKQIVVSGDVIGTLLDGYFGWNGSIDFDKQKYLKSLKRFSKYNSDMMLPGHGMIYFHSPRRRVEQAFNQALCQWR